jgi:microsomal dipeptidase-like Zn-dependent dipeptidase
VRNQSTDNYGAYIAQFDADNRQHWADAFWPFVDDPLALTQIPTVDDWVEMVTCVSNLVGPDHVGIGLDMLVAGATSSSRADIRTSQVR